MTKQDRQDIVRESEFREKLKTPRAAAVAGILFAILFTVSIVLIRLAIPEQLSGPNVAAWLQSGSGQVKLALELMPFAGIAFLWFMGVVRSRLGDREDQLFSTVFFGSGLLFLAMIFTTAALAGGMLTSYALAADRMVNSDAITFGRAVMYTITNVYAVRMAGVFMMSLGTIWVRTHVMPRPIVWLTYLLAIVLLLTINLSLWVLIIFPAWVFTISVIILVASMRSDASEGQRQLASNE